MKNNQYMAILMEDHFGSMDAVSNGRHTFSELYAEIGRLEALVADMTRSRTDFVKVLEGGQVVPVNT